MGYTFGGLGWTWPRVIGRQASLGFEAEFAFIELAEFEVFKVDGPLAVAHGLESDFLPDQRVGDEDVVSLPLELAAGLHPALGPLAGITSLLRKPFGIIARGRLVDFRRRTLSERFVRALLVVLAPEL